MNWDSPSVMFQGSFRVSSLPISDYLRDSTKVDHFPVIIMDHNPWVRCFNPTPPNDLFHELCNSSSPSISLSCS